MILVGLVGGLGQEESMSYRFKVGDKVTWCGIVIDDYKFKRESSGSLLVEFEASEPTTARGKQRLTFSYDGRFLPWHLEPSLNLEIEQQ